MTECDYCGQEVAEEDYHDHLREEHADELGPIDRRKVGEEEDGEFPTGPVVLLFVVGTITAVIVYFVFFFGSGGGGGGAGTGSGGTNAAGLPEQGDDALLQAVQSFPSEGNDHVSAGTEIQYDTSPPTSGPHYTSTVSAGFYDEPRPAGALVHTLEHGAVIVYYDPAALDQESRADLEALASEYTGTWQSVVVVPNPAENPESPYVLTAWRQMLRMDGYDGDVVRAFMAEYLGRGPENPVR
jgi:hypothetical protein